MLVFTWVRRCIWDPSFVALRLLAGLFPGLPLLLSVLETAELWEGASRNDPTEPFLLGTGDDDDTAAAAR